MSALPDFKGIYRSFRTADEEAIVKKQASNRLAFFAVSALSMICLRMYAKSVGVLQ